MKTHPGSSGVQRHGCRALSGFCWAKSQVLSSSWGFNAANVVLIILLLFFISRFQKAIRESGAGELAKFALYAYVQDDELQDWARAIMAKLGIKLDLVGFDCCCVLCMYVCM
jgi:hypothetical protein